jgi:two-component system, LytTR family, sensor kinase
MKRIAKIYLWSAVCWAALAPFLAFEWWRNAVSMNLNLTLGVFLGMVLGEYAAYALLTPIVFEIIRRFPIKKPHLIRNGLAYCFGAVPFLVLAPAIRCVFIAPYDYDAHVWLPRTLNTVRLLIASRFADTLTTYVLILAAGHAFEFYNRTRTQEVEQIDLRRTLAESELQMLRTQLHPHFLFNTLQGISSLTDEDPRLAKHMVGALADLLRAALKHSSIDLVSLRTEMEFVGAYLDLEKMRLGDRLSVRIHISADAKECLVPQLLLQPIVENAIVHGIAASRSGGWIDISSELNEQHLRLRVRNSTSGHIVRGTGLGLRNTRSRLKYLYSEDATLSFNLTGTGTAETLVVIPALRGSTAICTAS